MQTQTHYLPAASLGTQRCLQSLHFGRAETGRKAYLQASLHADELPGMLVLHHLRALLEAAEAAGQILAEIVIVPLANPIGLAQGIDYAPMGRFELYSGANFNRHFPDLLALAGDEAQAVLGPDEATNAVRLRELWRARLAGLKPASEVEAMRLVLMRLACDAEVVLDLHCDYDALMHIYTETSFWPQTEPLARYLGAAVTLTAEDSGGQSFDESLSIPWARLRARQVGRSAAATPVPLGCLAVTVELRGAHDVEHRYARADAAAIFAFLQHRGLIAGPAPQMPELINGPTPLAGSESVVAPHAGVITHLREPGARVAVGEVVAEVIDVLANRTTPIHAGVEGLLYARVLRRYVHAGMEVCRIAGSKAFRLGYLLAP